MNCYQYFERTIQITRIKRNIIIPPLLIWQEINEVIWLKKKFKLHVGVKKFHFGNFSESVGMAMTYLVRPSRIPRWISKIIFVLCFGFFSPF